MSIWNSNPLFAWSAYVGEPTQPASTRHLCSPGEGFIHREDTSTGCCWPYRQVQKSSAITDEADWGKNWPVDCS